MILRLRSLTASLLEACLETGRGSPLKCRIKWFMSFNLVGVFFVGGGGVDCLGGGECWALEAVTLA